MSRHRNIRSMNFNEEYDEYYNTYGQSVEEDFCISPNTERQFMYNRSDSRRNRPLNDQNNDSSDLMNTSFSEELEEDLDHYRNDSNMDQMERAKLISCVEEMENVVGDTIPESVLIRAAKLHNYDIKQALDSVLNAHTIQMNERQEKVVITKGKVHNKRSFGQNSDQLVVKQNKTSLQMDGNEGSTSSSPLFLSLTAKYQSNNEFTKTNHFCDIKKCLIEYFGRNDIKVFDFETDSPDDCLRKLKTGSRSTEMPKPLETVDQCDTEVEKINQNIQKMGINVNKSDNNLKNHSSPVRKDLDKSKPLLEPNSGQQYSSPNSPITSRAGSGVSSPIPTEKGSEMSKSSVKPIQTKALNPEMVLSEYNKSRRTGKPHINLVIIGHVDAGKSTLMGHMLYRLGFVSKKAIHRYETDSKKIGKNSFLYAWVLDETEEERSRGITMDIAQSKFETDNRCVTLLDAPGHKDFIPNMITGATQADVALLVVDATKGEFETGFESGGQTREHTLLIRSLGISQLGVVVNKLDNVNWNSQRYHEIIDKLSQFLKQVGFKESDVSYVPCSGLTGENLTERSKIDALCSWYSGPSLVEIIDNFKPPERPISKPFRMCISDVFKGQTSGLSVSGRVEAGAVTSGQKVVVLPAGEVCVVKSISIDDTSIPTAFVGDHIILILSGCDANNITVGSLVCDALNPAPVTTRFEARVVIFNNIEVPITRGFPVVFHYQSLSEQAVVKKIVSQIHKSTGQVIKNKPRCLVRNSSGIVEIEVQRPVCVELYKDYKDLGRFMIRSAGATVAAGLITKIL